MRPLLTVMAAGVILFPGNPLVPTIADPVVDFLPPRSFLHPSGLRGPGWFVPGVLPPANLPHPSGVAADASTREKPDDPGVKAAATINHRRHCPGSGRAASIHEKPDHALRLPTKQDCFFTENDLAYSRFLRLSRDGSYQQIDQNSTGSTEADRGTWEQEADAVVLLHAERRGLRFRAVRSGPLTVVLDSPDKIAALPEVAAAIRRLLAASQDDVFEADAAHDLGAPPAAVTVDRRAETFSRSDLVALAAQSDAVYQTEHTHTYRLTPLRPAGGPLLLVLQGATFGPDQVEAVRRDYHVPRGDAPPFYFAQTDARSFANRVGRYQAAEAPDGSSKP